MTMILNHRCLPVASRSRTLGQIRTDTVVFLRHAPPANWATRASLVDLRGIEPRPAGCKPAVLPLSLQARVGAFAEIRTRIIALATRDSALELRMQNGAAYRNRTDVFSLEGCNSAIELTPRWRMVRDSNSGDLSVLRFSGPPVSATHPTIHLEIGGWGWDRTTVTLVRVNLGLANRRIATLPPIRVVRIDYCSRMMTGTTRRCSGVVAGMGLAPMAFAL